MKCGTWLRRPTTLVSILFLFYADVLLSNKHICLLHKQSSKEVVLFSLSGWLLFGKVVLSFLHIVGLLLWNRSAVFGKYLLAQVAACFRTEMGMGGSALLTSELRAAHRPLWRRQKSQRVCVFSVSIFASISSLLRTQKHHSCQPVESLLRVCRSTLPAPQTDYCTSLSSY